MTSQPLVPNNLPRTPSNNNNLRGKCTVDKKRKKLGELTEEKEPIKHENQRKFLSNNPLSAVVPEVRLLFHLLANR